MSHTRQQWATIAVIGSVHFFSAISVSLQAPFYPQEAESKGGTPTEYGLVFGIFELTAFLTCPLFGKYLHKTGAKFTVGAGVSLAGISLILFGLLDFLQGHVVFISLSLIVRVCESLGASAAITAAFAITASVFPESVATTFASLEICYGVGFIVGPTLGGFLFIAGGYIAPFAVVGLCLILLGVLIFVFLPNPPYVQSENTSKKAHGVFSMLSVVSVQVDVICIMAASSAMGFYAATLEPHLRQFDLAPTALYSMFVLSGGMYALCAPIVGRLCDKYVAPRSLTFLGCVMEILASLLVGPAAFFTTVDSSVGLCVAGLILHGVGLGLLFVSCFIDAMRSSIASGFEDGLATYGLVAGLWASSFSLGGFIGPSVAGLLLDQFSFRPATYFLFTEFCIATIIVLISVLRRKSTSCVQLLLVDQYEQVLLPNEFPQSGLSSNEAVYIAQSHDKNYGAVSSVGLAG